MNKLRTSSPLVATLRPARKTREGMVVSDKTNKTRVIEVSWNVKHSRYHKILRRSRRLYAHDEKNDSHVGDRVELFETRLLSKLKCWRISRILQRSLL